jgi:Ca-activated chloride channel family protein
MTQTTLNPTLSIKPLKANAPLAAAAELRMLVSIACPMADVSKAPKRPRLNLSLSIDKSGSMRGRPLEQAKVCATRLVDALEEGDVLSVNAYDNKVEVVVAPTPVVDRMALKRAIAGIHTGGNTNLHAGWLAAAEAGVSGLAPDVLTRVMLLSDGEANAGIQDHLEIARQAAALATKGVVTSTIGLGNGFNEELMTSLAQAGGGQASYGETADDLWPSFEAELGLLSATCGKAVRLKLHSPCGGIVTLPPGYQVAGPGEWLLPNLAYGAEVAVLVTVSVDALSGNTAEVLQATVTYDGIEGTAAASTHNSLVQPTVPFADFVLGAVNPVVAERVKEAEAALLQLEANEAARRHDFITVRGIAAKLSGIAGDNAWLLGQAARMSELAQQGDATMLRKESTYASSSLRSSYTSTSGDATLDASFLKKRVRQGKAD